MNKLDHQLQRLLQAAAAVPPRTDEDPGTVPDARWLLRQREQQEATISATLRPVLQGGLAVACLILLVTSLINLRQINQANEDLFAVSGAVLTRVSTP